LLGIRPVTRGGEAHPAKNFAPLEKLLGIVEKYWIF